MDLSRDVLSSSSPAKPVVEVTASDQIEHSHRAAIDPVDEPPVAFPKAIERRLHARQLLASRTVRERRDRQSEKCLEKLDLLIVGKPLQGFIDLGVDDEGELRDLVSSTGAWLESLQPRPQFPSRHKFPGRDARKRLLTTPDRFGVMGEDPVLKLIVGDR